MDVVRGAAGDMKAMGIYESFRVKNQVVTSAVEAAEMILRVDDIIRAAPRRRGAPARARLRQQQGKRRRLRTHTFPTNTTIRSANRTIGART